MSFEPPPIKFYLYHAHKQVDAFEEEARISAELASNASQVQDELAITADLLHKSIDQFSSSRMVKSVNEERDQKVSTLVTHILSEGRTVHSKMLEKAADRLLNKGSYYAEVISHWSEVEEKGIEPFSHEPWALNELLFWVNQDNAWAIDQLEQLTSHKDPLAAHVLWILGHQDPKYIEDLKALVTKRVDIFPCLKEILWGTLDPAADKQHAEGALKTLYQLISKGESADAYAIIFEYVENVSNVKPICYFFMDLLVTEGDYPLLFSLLFNKIKAQDEWAIQLLNLWVNHFETHSEKMKKSPFWIFLVKEAYEDMEVQIILVASSKIQMGLVEYKSVVEEALTSHPAKPGTIASELYFRLKSNHEKLERILRDLQNKFPRKFTWTASSPFFRYTLIHAHLSRIKRLMCLLLGEGQAEVLDPPISDSFERPKFALVGANRHNQDVLAFMAEMFNQMGVSTMSVMSKNDNFIKPPVEPLEGEHSTNLWIRDYFSLHKESVRSPPIFFVSTELRGSAKAERLARMKEVEGEDFDIQGSTVYGAIAKQQEQVCFFDYCTTLFTQQNRSPKERLVQFLFTEGGNVLRGKSGIKSYILFGRDILGLNRHPVQHLLAELGLSKNDTGRWRLGAPYNPKDATFKVEDRDMMRLLAEDWGVDEVYPIEQPDYHLDVAMCLADAEKKVVLLSDSLASAKVLKKHYTSPKVIRELMHHQVMEVEEKIRMVFEEAECRSYFERKAKTDLEKAGFTVISVPGMFYELEKENPMDHQVNFFNLISCLNDKDEKCIFALGVPPFLKDLCRETYEIYIPDLKHIYFAPIKGSQNLLRRGGGLHCITQLVY